VTCTLVAANALLFAAMAVAHGRLYHFSRHVLVTWGGVLAPRVFDGQWWRAGTSLFVHGDLSHLVGNLFFLLLIAPLMERVLGSARLALVYLFAGLGGGLLGMGAHPQGVGVGASAAVFGVYGALLGCCLSGPRSIPWKAVAQRTGLVLLFVVFGLLEEWLREVREPTAHLGGFVFGLIGGLLCGHRLQGQPAVYRTGLASRLLRVLPYGHRLEPWAGFAWICVLCAGLVGATAWWVMETLTLGPID
jgi:rhomboid protease GluP